MTLCAWKVGPDVNAMLNEPAIATHQPYLVERILVARRFIEKHSNDCPERSRWTPLIRLLFNHDRVSKFARMYVGTEKASLRVGSGIILAPTRNGVVHSGPDQTAVAWSSTVNGGIDETRR